MKEINILKGILTALGTFLGYFLGGFDSMLITLIVLMIIDYITGVMNAIVQKKLSSSIGFKGIFKKILILLLVGVATRLDVILDTNTIRLLVISFYLANEGISIVENASMLGLPVPQKLKNILEQLKDEEKESE